MTERKINRIVVLGVFFVSLVVYVMTLPVTVVFWDVGEFCASAWLLQVPHPPGSPLFILIARVVAMVPFLPDIAARMHAISAVASALGVTFLYLVAVKIIGRFRGSPQTFFDRFIVYGSSVVGAFALALSPSYWDNATEAEVYALSMLFVSFVLWLAFRWWERADEPHNEKYMLLIAYLIGLSVGIHLLALLALFSILMLVYFRRYEVNRRNTIRLALISVVVFFVIYPGVVQYLPSMLDGEFKGMKSGLLTLIPPLILMVAGYGAYRTSKTRQKMLHIACLSFLLIVIGYTTYIVVLMRSNVDNLPMNENNPNNLARLTSYLGREQYGEAPLLKGPSWDNELQGYREKLFPRRRSEEAMHDPTRVNYTSDTDFFLRYQMYHMFIRYLLQNFVGAEGDWQDAGWSGKETFGIPLLIGLIGLYYHTRRDVKNSLVIIVLFVVMGPAFMFYANMQEPQPRERDYFYVGAFYAFCIWIAIGVVAILDFLKMKLKQEGAYKVAAFTALSICTAVIPINLARTNWFEHDRSQLYIAWDYSYNLLQSCKPNSILFTNGDNDTFPLWYLQDVEGVRRDIRIANLSLINTNWYILQLKNQTPHEAQKVPISLTNQQIERIQPVRWTQRDMELPVPKDVYERFGITDTGVINKGKITWTMTGRQFSQDVRFLQVQDIMVRDIVLTNKWERPIYFATTVSPDAKIGLDNYLWMQGLAWELKPIKVPSVEAGVDPEIMEANVMAQNVVPSKELQYGFLYRNLDNPNVYYDENARRTMMMNYRATFMRVAFYAMKVENNMEKARKAMARMEEVMPINIVPIQDWRLTADIMRIYHQVGDTARFEIYANIVEKACLDLLYSGNFDPTGSFSPYGYLLDIYDTRKDYVKALDILKRASVQFPNDPTVKSRIQFYEQQLKGSSPGDTTTSQ
ncbi:MAG: DUF2723 domain-containing protein [Ignavibacteriae bacterium]|nr:DUF2723 domain-containing protein [Ignavibacteriota bacterium]